VPPPPPPPKMRPLRAVALRAAWVTTAFAAAPPHPVGDAAALRAAFDDPSIDVIALTRSFGLAGSREWAGAPAVVGGGRALVVKSANASAPATLNLTTPSPPVILVAPNGSLALASAVFVGAPPPRPDAPGAVADYPATPDVGLWPSISLAPGSEIGMSNVTLYVYGGCGAIGQCLKENGGAGVLRDAQTVVSAGAGVDLLLRAGRVECGEPVVANRTRPGAGHGERRAGGERGEGGEG